MKKLKVLLAVLCLVLCAGVLCSCQSSAEKMAALEGSWTIQEQDSEENARDALVYADFYDEEIALVDLTTLEDVTLVQFDAQGNYLFAWDVEGIKRCLRDYYDGAFASMYEGRTTLDELYGVSFESYSREEFNQFYAELYTCTDYEQLLDVLAENAYDYEALAEPLETGTFTIRGSRLMCTITGESEAEALGFKVEGDTLTLIFVDGERVFTRAH